MAKVDKLIKFLNADNIAELLDEEQHKAIADEVIIGYDIDEDSRAPWLQTNKEAMEIIKNYENSHGDPDKDFPFYKASKVVYPLISPAVIQLASRLIQHIVRNDKVAECVVLGDDPEGVKQDKAKRVSDFLSYELLIESDTWLFDQHKLCHILASWGTAFKEVYYDRVSKKNCAEILPPEDVIINHNITALSQARRITIRCYLTKNEIIERQRAGQFIDFDVDELLTHSMDNSSRENDSRETKPVFEILKQYCYLDLDEDEYEEPYCVYVHKDSKTLLGIYPAYEISDLNIDAKGKILSITPRNYIVDYHLIDDPEGKFYSLGLNQLLLHQNKSITAVLRQLLDAGTLSNTAATSGFVTKSFKTKEKSMKFKLGEFKQLDVMPGTDIRQQIMSLPFNEPSQVLLALLEFLVTSGKETGYMTDVLTGDVQGQNVPATTMLAMVEQGTRAFKPVVQKLFMSLKKEFKMWFHLHHEYLDEAKYFRFQDKQEAISKEDFDETNLDIVPVADPTMSSEAHKYARLQAMWQVLQTPAAQALNIQNCLSLYFTELQFPNVESLIAQPQPAPPDPKLIKVQVDAQKAQAEHQINLIKTQLEEQKLENEKLKTMLKATELGIKEKEARMAGAKTIVDAHKESVQLGIQQRMAYIAEQEADNERERITILEKQSRNKDSSKKDRK